AHCFGKNLTISLIPTAAQDQIAGRNF
ncbi:unnamed protein product, partial [Oikopleura dioica]